MQQLQQPARSLARGSLKACRSAQTIDIQVCEKRCTQTVMLHALLGNTKMQLRRNKFEMEVPGHSQSGGSRRGLCVCVGGGGGGGGGHCEKPRKKQSNRQ